MKCLMHILGCALALTLTGSYFVGAESFDFTFLSDSELAQAIKTIEIDPDNGMKHRRERLVRLYREHFLRAYLPGWRGPTK